MNPRVQIPKVLLQIQPVLLPRHAIHPRRGLGLDRPVRRPQAIDVNVVQERREPRFLVRCRHSAHTTKLTGRALPGTESGARFAGRVSLGWSAFPPPPPPPRLGRCSAASQVVRGHPTSHDRASRDYGLGLPRTTRPTDMHPRSIKGGASSTGMGDVGPPGSQHGEIARMHGFFDPAGSANGSRERRQRCCLPSFPSTSAPRTSPISGLNSRPACTPVNASLRPHGSPTHDSGPS